MSDNLDVQYLRLLLAEPNPPNGMPAQPGQTLVGSLFSDDQLEMLIDRTALVTRAAEVGWKAKAAYLQPLVDIDESGVSRKLSQMYKNAMMMAAQYKITADEEWMAIQGSVRTVGIGASPWGPQYSRYPNTIFGSLIIGDVSRAGAGGSIFFIEVPIDPNILNEKLFTGNEPVDAAVVATTQFDVPTVRRLSLFVESGRSANFTFNYLDPTSGTIVDITGWSAQITVRTAPGGPILMQQALSVDVSDCAFIFADNGANTSGYGFVQGDYEVVATDGSGNSISLCNGTMFVGLGDG